MYCPHCGAQNADDAAVCSLCDKPLTRATRPPEAPLPGAPTFSQPTSGPLLAASYGAATMGAPPSMLGWAIAATLCCCLPFGVVAIVFASQANSRASIGDQAGAWENHQKAKTWCWVAFGLGLISNLLVAVVQGLAIVASIASEL